MRTCALKGLQHAVIRPKQKKLASLQGERSTFPFHKIGEFAERCKSHGRDINKSIQYVILSDKGLRSVSGSRGIWLYPERDEKKCAAVFRRR
jgi:hypothetical protein